MMDNLDLYLAGALVLTVVIVFVVSRIGVLPKKGGTYLVIGGVVAAAFGLQILRDRRRKAWEDQIDELERQRKESEKEFAEIKKQMDVSDPELAAARARVDQQIAASVKERLIIETRNAEERREIDTLPADETLRRFRELQKRLEDERRAREIPAVAAGGPGQ
jgi:septal ring factor EnvC (AmiA/AmiB activator)